MLENASGSVRLEDARLWKKKSGAVGTPVGCSPLGCADPNHVNNAYTWSATGAAPDGGVFTDFLAKLTDPTFGGAVTAYDVTGCFAGHCDWPLPNTAELQAIVDCSLGNPCIDPIFGPTQSGFYWSASTQAGPSPD